MFAASFLLVSCEEIAKIVPSTAFPTGMASDIIPIGAQSFDSAHFLSGYEGKCSNLHGHRWRVVARIAMDELNKEGQTRDMVIDFGDFKSALKKLTDALDHSFIFETGSLKERTVAALKDEGFLLHEVPFRPTAEQFSRYFYEQLKGLNFPVYDISVYETPTNCSTYREASL